MRTNWILYLTRYSAVTLLVCILCVSSSAQQEALGRSCSGEIMRVSLYPSPPSCKEWVIEWRKSDGSKSSNFSVTARTREEVINKRDKKLAFERLYARWFNDDTSLVRDYSNPSDPICEMCMGVSPTHDAFSWARVCKKAPLNFTCNSRGAMIENYVTRIIDGMGQFAIARDRTGDPPPTVGSVLWDYASAMREAQERVNHFKSWLDVVTSTSDIDKLMDEALNAGRNYDAKYNALPREARDWLDGRVRSPARLQGYWSLQGDKVYIKQEGDSFQLGSMEGNTFYPADFSGTIVGNTIVLPDYTTEMRLDNPSQCGVAPHFRVRQTGTRQGTISGNTITVEIHVTETRVGPCLVKAKTMKMVLHRWGTAPVR